MIEQENSKFKFVAGVGIGNYYLGKDKMYFLNNYEKPREIVIDYFNENEYSESFIYDDGVIIDFSYYDKVLDNYKIFSTKYFFIENINLYGKPMKTVLENVHNLHRQLKKKYLYDKDTSNNSCFFYNIGLTLWLENNYLSDACIESI